MRSASMGRMRVSRPRRAGFTDTSSTNECGRSLCGRAGAAGCGIAGSGAGVEAGVGAGAGAGVGAGAETGSGAGADACGLGGRLDLRLGGGLGFGRGRLRGNLLEDRRDVRRARRPRQRAQLWPLSACWRQTRLRPAGCSAFLMTAAAGSVASVAVVALLAACSASTAASGSTAAAGSGSASGATSGSGSITRTLGRTGFIWPFLRFQGLPGLPPAWLLLFSAASSRPRRAAASR